MGVLTPAARSCLHTSTPLIPGIRKSAMIRLGLMRRACSKPRLPSATSTGRKPSVSSRRPIVSRRFSSSSMTRMVCMPLLLVSNLSGGIHIRVTPWSFLQRFYSGATAAPVRSYTRANQRYLQAFYSGATTASPRLSYHRGIDTSTRGSDDEEETDGAGGKRRLDFCRSGVGPQWRAATPGNGRAGGQRASVHIVPLRNAEFGQRFREDRFSR